MQLNYLHRDIAHNDVNISIGDKICNLESCKRRDSRMLCLKKRQSDYHLASLSLLSSQLSLAVLLSAAL